MSQMYKLNLGKSYANMKSVFRAGETFTAEELGADVHATNDEGVLYFVPVTEDAPAVVAEATSEQEASPAVDGEAEKTKGGHKVVIGKKKAAEDTPTEIGGITL